MTTGSSCHQLGHKGKGLVLGAKGIDSPRDGTDDRHITQVKKLVPFSSSSLPLVPAIGRADMESAG